MDRIGIDKKFEKETIIDAVRRTNLLNSFRILSLGFLCGSDVWKLTQNEFKIHLSLKAVFKKVRSCRATILSISDIFRQIS